MTYVTEEQRSRTGWIASGAGWLGQPKPIAGGHGNLPRVPIAIGCEVLVEILADGTRLRPGLLLDRDGVINEECHYLHDPKDLVMISGVDRAIAEFNQRKIPVVVVTNQAGIGRGIYGVEAYQSVNRAICEHLARVGARIDAWYFCPHAPQDACRCRKPQPGMLMDAAKDLGLSLCDSILVGDKDSDLEAARAAGCRAVLVRTGYGAQVERDLLSRGRGGAFDHCCDSLPAAMSFLTTAFAADKKQISREDL